MANHLSVFSVPIMGFMFSKHAEYDFTDPGKIENTPQGWQWPVNSSYPNIQDDDPLVTPKVRDRLKKDLMTDIVSLLYDYGIPDKVTFDQFWYNSYHSGQGQEPHTHIYGCNSREPYWCGIYYNKNASPTRFYRPDNNNKFHSFPYNSSNPKSQLFQEYLAAYIEPQVQDGFVLLFPPYLRHSVTHSDDKMRLTFSFNLMTDV